MRRLWMTTLALALTLAAATAPPAAAQSRAAGAWDGRLAEIERALMRSRRAIDRAGPELERLRLNSELQRARLQVRGAEAMALAEARAAFARARRAPSPRPPGPPRPPTPRVPRTPGMAVAGPAFEVPEPWLAQDPADSLYREARGELNARRYAAAARLFAEIRRDFPRSGYVGDAYYFEALARTRDGGRRALREALELLATQRTEHPDAASAEDARALTVRIEAQLARRGDARAAEALVGAARGGEAGQAACDEDEQAMRATALSALLQMDADRARPILQEVLGTRDECTAPLRAQAVFILAQQIEEGDGTVELLVDLAHGNPDPDPEVREAAVFWLSQTGRAEAVDALLAILDSGTATPEIAEQAVFALGQSGRPEAFRALRDYAADPDADPEIRANAIFWLGEAGGDEAAAFLRSIFDTLDDPELAEGVLFAIAESGDAADLDWLTARALDPTEEVEVRKAALFWAGEAGLTAAQALEVYRTAPDAELREQAIFVLTQGADDDEAVDALLEIVRTEDDPELREQAVFWLGQSDDPRVAEILLDIVRGGGGGER